MIKLYLFIILSIVIRFYGCSQTVYYGLPQEEVELTKGDIIIVEEIHWQNGFTQFSDIGMSQIDCVRKFLEKHRGNQFELLVHSFHGVEALNQKVSEETAKEIRDKLSISKNVLVDVKGVGSSKPLVNLEDRLKSNQYNNRIEILVLK